MKNKLLIAAIMILCVETIYLSIVNRNLNKEVKKYRYLFYSVQKSGNGHDALPVSIPDANLIGVNDGGEKRLFDISGTKKTLLFIFSTECYLCDEMSTTWNDIFEVYRDTYEIMGISLNSTPETEDYVARNAILFPVYMLKDREDETRFESTPLTILLNTDGTVLSSYAGFSENLNKLNLKEI